MDISKRKLSELIREIADLNNAGLIVFVHKMTLKIIFVPDHFHIEYDDFDGAFDEDLKDLDQNFQMYWKFEPPGSHESYDIMCEFVNQVDQMHLRQKLVSALNRRKPFANFKHIIDNSMIRENWFKFKDQKLRARVKIEFEIELENQNKLREPQYD